MRKNFTKFFLGLVLMVGMTTMSTAQCEFDPPPGSVYDYRFDGGLEGWRSLDAAGFETTAGWQWDATGSLKQGFYSGNLPDVIASESQCNGAVVFDSDFLDNAGLGDAGFGTGDCPADCNGYLVSPVMDLSAVDGVELEFTQYTRNFQSSYFVYLSIDGGATNVDTFEINTGFATNAFYPTETLTVPLCAAANQSEVVVTFHWEANYYVWAIDDVFILEAEPSVNMRVNNNFYAKVGNFSTPFNMVKDVMPLADIENLTVFDSPDATLNFNAYDSDGAEIFSTARPYGSVPGCSTDENKIFPEVFPMPNTIGDYTLEYTLQVDGDLDLEDNSLTAPFRVSENEFRKLPTQEEVGSEFLSGVRYGSGYCSWGSYFYFPQNDMEQGIDSVSLGIIANAGDVPSTGVITIAVYDWVDLDDIGSINAGELIKLGETIQFVEPFSPEFIQWTVAPRDPNGDIIIPEPGANIVVIGHSGPFDGNTNYFFNAVPDTGFEIYSQGATNLAHREADLMGGYASFASGDSAADTEEDRDNRDLFNVDGAYVFDINLLLTPIDVSSEDINEDLGVKIFPSPATTQFTVDLNLEEVSDKVSIEVTDFAGNKVAQYNYNNVKKDRMTIDVSTLTAGMYLVNVRTEAGMISKKISVIR